MKKIYLPIIVIFALLLLTSCNTKFEDDMLNVVIDTEKLDHEFSNFQITYDEYIDKVQKYFTNNYEKKYHYNRRYVPDPIDLKSFTKTELEEAGKDLSNQSSISIQTSKPYKENEEKYYVFTKSIIDFKDPKTEGLIITRKYKLTKTDNMWKITELEQDMSGKETPEDKLKYTTKDNKKVKYIKTFNID